MFGINDFTAVINAPQAAILAVGEGKRKFKIVSPSAPMNKDNVRVANVVNVCLSADRRYIDEVTAAQFLQCLQKYMKQPSLLSM